ncbi:MAG: signal peptidase II [Paracoccaceae bacterium]|jgi:signal peptidase II
MANRSLIVAGFLAFLIDQISKYLVVHWLSLSRVHSIDVFPPLLNFRYGENRGINFGLFNDGSDTTRWILIGFSLVVIVAVYIWTSRKQPVRLMQISAGLLIGGALGNIGDRLIYGYVVDFINMSCCGINNPFVFNVADVFIFVGAMGLIVFDKKPSGQKGS